MPTFMIPWFETKQGFGQFEALAPDTHQLKFALQGTSDFRRAAQMQFLSGGMSAMLDGRLILLRNISVNDRGNDLPLICDANYESEPTP